MLQRAFPVEKLRESTSFLLLGSLKNSSLKSFFGKSFASGNSVDIKINAFNTSLGGFTSSEILEQLKVRYFKHKLLRRKTRVKVTWKHQTLFSEPNYIIENAIATLRNYAGIDVTLHIGATRIRPSQA